ncbi:hypothetical protein J6590_057443 [Homalodisca vitripennis]|nr:hypothetical protein J6590_057443 [Homalodisca vitripennis]
MVSLEVWGNKRVDALVNLNTATSMTEPEPFCGISRCESFVGVSKWVHAEHERRWELHLKNEQNGATLAFTRGLITEHGHLRSIFTALPISGRIHAVEFVMDRRKLLNTSSPPVATPPDHHMYSANKKHSSSV